MTASPFIVVPHIVPGASALQLDPSLVSPLMPTLLEAGAIGHWLLGDDNPTRADLVSGQLLRRAKIATITNAGSGYTTAPTVTATGDSLWSANVASGAVTQVWCRDPGTSDTVPTLSFSGGGGSGAAATASLAAAPTLNTGYASLASGLGGALVTPFADRAAITVCTVHKWKSAAGTNVNYNLFGTVAGSGIDSAGSGLFSSVTAGVRSISSTVRGSTLSSTAVPLPGALAAGDWLFAALAEGSAFDAMTGGGAVQTPGSGTKTVSNRKVAIGQAYFLSASYNTNIEVAEVIVFDRYLSRAERDAVYVRSKARLAPRGITLP